MQDVVRLHASDADGILVPWFPRNQQLAVFGAKEGRVACGVVAGVNHRQVLAQDSSLPVDDGERCSPRGLIRNSGHKVVAAGEYHRANGAVDGVPPCFHCADTRDPREVRPRLSPAHVLTVRREVIAAVGCQGEMRTLRELPYNERAVGDERRHQEVAVRDAEAVAVEQRTAHRR